MHPVKQALLPCLLPPARRVNLVVGKQREHGAHHEGADFVRHAADGNDGGTAEHGDQPSSPHRTRAQQEGEKNVLRIFLKNVHRDE